MIQIIVGGILYLLEKIKVKQVIIGKQFEESENYKKFIQIIKDKKIKVRLVQLNEKIIIEKNVYFKFNCWNISLFYVTIW